MSVEAERIVADARRFAENQAKYSNAPVSAVVREACIVSYLQGFKAGLTHAVKEAVGVPS